MARADQGPPPPTRGARLETCCRRSLAPGHNRHSAEGRGADSRESSPVSTQERVSGSLRSSMFEISLVENYRTRAVIIAQPRAISTKDTKVHEVKARFPSCNFVFLVVDDFDLF